MKKLYIIKNTKTGKYYSNDAWVDYCTAKNIANAQVFEYNNEDQKWTKKVNKNPTQYGFNENEKYIEIEIKEKK